MRRFLGWLFWGPAPRQIRDYDDHGRLVRAGFAWSELRHPFAALLWQVAFTFGGIGIAQLVIDRLLMGYAPAIFAIGGSIACLIGGIAFLLAMSARRSRREMIFALDGSVRTPCGTLAYGRKRVLPFRQDAIANIQAKARGKDFILLIIGTNGGDAVISSQLDESVARMAAVQLTKALDDLRVGQLKPLTPTAAAQPQQLRQGPLQIEID